MTPSLQATKLQKELEAVKSKGFELFKKIKRLKSEIDAKNDVIIVKHELPFNASRF